MDDSAPPKTPHVSAVICTRNRPDKIGTAVASVLASDYPSFDLTVIDQSTTDATGQIVEPVAAADPRLIYVHVDEAGLSRAYNNGISRTDGEILVFTDDDCIVPIEWISNVVAAFTAEPDADLLYGQVLPIEGTDDPDGWSPMLPIEHAERLSRKDGFRVFGMGANFAARRRLFDTIGLFDTVLGGGGPLKSSQDYDIAYRAFHADRIIVLRPEVTLRHDGRREAGDWPALLLAYGTGDGAFYMKHMRCRDPYAVWLFVRRLAHDVPRLVAKKVLRRAGTEGPYLRGMFSGVRGSFRFKVDRRRRLYVEA